MNSQDTPKPLSAELAAQQLLRLHELTGHYRDLRLTVEVCSPGAVGGTPTVDIVTLQGGCDWDASKVLMRPAQPLTVLSAEDVAAIHASVRAGSSWHAYQAHKKLHERIRALETELAALKGAA